MEHYEKIIREERIYSGRIMDFAVRTVELEDGSTATREIVLHGDGVALVVVDGEDILLVSQYRSAAQREVLELPAGKMERGESPEECGLRELTEEVGLKAQRLLPLVKTMPIPPYCTEVVHIFEPQGLCAARQHLDEDEFLTVRRMPFATALSMVLDGSITDGKTQLGILYYAAKHGIM